jgi:hypothetical protein
VLGVFPTCVYVGFGGHADVLALVTSDGLSLPIGLRLGATSTEIATMDPEKGWGVQPGDMVEIGEGKVSLPRADVVAAREQRTRLVGAWPAARRVPTSRDGAALENGALDGRLIGGALVDAALVDAAERVAAAALAGRQTSLAVRRLMGAGAGLTPSGDDVLCGVVLTLRAAGRRDAVALLASEIIDAIGCTTSVSAALLRAACAGYALPEVLQLIDDLGTGAPSSPALERVLHVGHTSGRDLVAGITGTCRALEPALCRG